MNDDQEDELLLHVAAGTDPATAMAATDDDQRPTGGCLVMLLAINSLTFSVGGFRAVVVSDGHEARSNAPGCPLAAYNSFFHAEVK